MTLYTIRLADYDEHGECARYFYPYAFASKAAAHKMAERFFNNGVDDVRCFGSDGNPVTWWDIYNAAHVDAYHAHVRDTECPF